MQEQSAESLYQRVIRTGKIRAGYFLYPPLCVRDPNTGKLTGLFVDIMEEAGKKLNLKIEWTEEVGFGSMIEGLKTNRYDIVPIAVWPSSFRGREADFSVPLLYSGVATVTRADDNRFANVQAINNDSVTVSVLDGQVQDVIASQQFPRAHKISHPELSDSSEILLDVVDKKADVTFTEAGIFAIFSKSNPGKLKIIDKNNPIAVYGATMMFKINEPAFKSMLNVALTELLNTGYIDKLIAKYEPAPGAYYRVAKPYEIR